MMQAYLTDLTTNMKNSGIKKLSMEDEKPNFLKMKGNNYWFFFTNFDMKKRITWNK